MYDDDFKTVSYRKFGRKLKDINCIPILRDFKCEENGTVDDLLRFVKLIHLDSFFMLSEQKDVNY